MAIYHFSAKVISRANGASAVVAAAYRSRGAMMIWLDHQDSPDDRNNTKTDSTRYGWRR